MKQMPLLLPVLFSLLCCSNPRESPPAETPLSFPVVYGQYPLALLQSGENPLWFELTGQGPALIPAPEQAFLCPFVPWPLTRRVAGMVGKENRIILGINREGFLAFVPWEEGENGGIALYRIDNSAYWKDYSVESLFVFDSTPAALLYRDDYFIDNSLPPPSPRVWGLDAAGMKPLIAGAFEDLAPEDGWDIEALLQGPDDQWRYRAIRKSGGRRGIGYFRSGDLSLPGEVSTQGALQNASRPRSQDQAPEPLRQVLEAALAVDGETTAAIATAAIATVVSPEFESLRYYAAPQELDHIREDIRFCPGYYLAGDGYSLALVVDPEGRGFIGAIREGVFALREFALPALPKGFVYTGAAFFPLASSPDSGISVAALGIWEEQEGWNVGAAGFVLSPDYSILDQ
ncbi:MAG: hypothetical protein LBK63_03200 [Treponema sp.]|jgi:hypothetical protein|nr:hypothetical protein [Treponema sp.]